MSNTIFPTPSSVEDDFRKIEDKWKFEQSQKRIKESNKKHKEETKEEKRIQNRYFDLLKSLTILSATVFGSSIALATGKSLNCVFIFGELFLLLSTLIGILFLWSQLRSLEWSYFFNVTNRLKSEDFTENDLIKEYVGEARKDLIKSFEKLMNKKDVSYHILKVIKVDWLPGLFYTFLSIGLLFIWISLLI